MALSLLPIVSTAVFHRPLPIVSAFCVLRFCVHNLNPFITLPHKTGCAQSLSFVPPLRSKFCAHAETNKAEQIRMETSKTTVPSIVVYVTVPNKEAGKKLAESIVKERLAACVNRIPGVESVYEWKGKIETDSEELLIIKTRESLLEALTAHVKANHEYDVPEVIAMPITGGNQQYLEWLKNSTKD
ncbi:protein CutA, chloroplastic-like [Andrographis paniculata]|uniref:protein CutA, chloroplastic-like n=1 Tax=Andrographis paniculata TaxID=175694 RepID=UPI0021E8E6BF|nr:protein CutA, chloroplastic-like [Andrographis paniculata]